MKGQAPVTLDYATLIGMLAGFGLIGAALAFGGAPGSFLDLPSVLIVLGGTFAITTACFSLDEVVKAQRVAFTALLQPRHEPSRAAHAALQLSERARKEGILSLQSALPELGGEAFLQKTLQLLVDGIPADEMERLMRREMQSMAHRHGRSAGVFRKAAEVAPAMGLIGTLLGLVQMLGRLDDPASIGPGMALALLTTLYGAVLANMIFAPIASKLERNSGEEALVNAIYLTAAGCIARQENPRRLEMLLNSLLPPAKRVQYFD